ncbi:SH3 domain-containing protein [Aminobacter anthyllidis]|uniref:SH3 domain-containing protein n=1 Tax=Aminobacter anthyllidis TaxID=1035067 RepID=A0A9X1D223_9HYPH|nr:SH3 domain-containing protein [Aminobacter anthyllidis]MBT1154457.1 SH3 domain-containing protein [Aminobacter anthyllidis]
MSGFALPKLRWLVLGALAAGGWAMTQDLPSKARFDDRPARTANKPKTETAARKDAAVTRPKVNVAPRPQVDVARPKADIEPRKLATAAKPKTDVSPPKVAVATPAARERAPRKPAAEIETASIARPPTPLPRPKSIIGEAATKSGNSSAASLNVLYTSTSVYLRQRPSVSAPVTSSLKQGESVRVFARDGKWTLVSASGRKGWVHGDLLRPADPAAPRPKQTLGHAVNGATPG